MKNVERIEAMEHRLNRAMNAVHELKSALEHYPTAQEDVRILDEYLGSKDWKSDLAADEAGLLPADLMRGVLSEDGIWNLLAEWRELEEQVTEFVELIINNK